MRTKEILKVARHGAKPFRVSKGKDFRLKDVDPNNTREFTTDLDFSAGRAVMDLHRDLAQAGVVLALSRLQVRPHDDLERMGLVKLIGANRIFDSRHACIEAYRSEAKS